MTAFNAHVLMSDAQHFANDLPINPYYHDESIDRLAAIQEHAAIKSLLESAGVKVTQVPSPAGCQDGVYTANWGLIRGNKAVLSRLPSARKSEEAYAKQVLSELGIEAISVPAAYKFSGQGDALPCGKYLLCGSGYRSDETAQAFAADYLGFERIQLRALPEVDDQGQPVINQSSGWADSFFYDIDLAVAVIRVPTSSTPGLVAYCPEALTPASSVALAGLSDIELITVSLAEAQEAFACNLVSTGETVVMSARAPELTQKLHAYGIATLTPDISELAKGGGYIRCTTLTIA